VPEKASILMDYVTLDGKGSKRFDLSPKPAEWDQQLDFAITKAEGHPTAEYGFAHISARPAEPGQSLMLIHHPQGRPKVISRFRCVATRDQEPGPALHHRCDTLAGSSGALMFNGHSSGVALHREGGLDPRDPTSYNSATQLAAIAAASKILHGALDVSGEASSASQKPPVTSPNSSGSTTLSVEQMNDLLRGK